MDSDVDRHGMCQFPVARAQERSNHPSKTEATRAIALDCQDIDAQAPVGVDFRNTIEWLQGCGKVGEWIGTTVYACSACRFRLAGKGNAIRRGEEVKCMQCGGGCRFKSKGRFDEWSCGVRTA